MPMLLIQGTFRILGAQPDGDSIRFTPNDPDEWNLVEGPHRVRRNAHGGAQLRLDGIDSLETHFTTTGQILHQPLDLAHQAADALVDLVGFSDVVRSPEETVTSGTPDETPGYILTRGADLHGRCVALAGSGDPPGPSGQPIRVEVPLLQQTVNFKQLEAGLAYPTYYKKLFLDLRNAMTQAVAGARQAQRGVWQSDQTESGATIAGVQTLEDDVVILPKLFRRLADYLELNHGDPSLAAFPDFLAQRGDPLFIISTGHPTGLHFVVEVDGQTVKLTRPPEDLVFEEG
jgi:endonuclease YncB( thermonuclease family)